MCFWSDLSVLAGVMQQQCDFCLDLARKLDGERSVLGELRKENARLTAENEDLKVRTIPSSSSLFALN